MKNYKTIGIVTDILWSIFNLDIQKLTVLFIKVEEKKLKHYQEYHA